MSEFEDTTDWNDTVTQPAFIEEESNTTLIDDITSTITEEILTIFSEVTDYPINIPNFNHTTNSIIESSTTMNSFLIDNVTTFMHNISNETTLESVGVVPKQQFPGGMLGFTAACAFIIAIFGASGNLLTIFALPMCRKLRTTATAFVINLALVELLFCIVILPISGAQYVYLQYNNKSLLSDSHCAVFTLCRYTFTQVQLQTIVGIALTRAIAVGAPRFYQKINNTYIITSYIAAIWLYAFFLKLPTALGVFGKFVFNKGTMECDMGIDPVSKAVRKLALLIEFIIPVFVVIILYLFIFIMVIGRSLRRNKRLRKSSARSLTSVKKSSMRVRRASVKSLKSTLSSTPSVTEEPSKGDNESPKTERRTSSASYKSLKRMVSESNFATKLKARRSSSITNCINTNRRDLRVARTIFIIFVMVMVCSVPVGYVHTTDDGTQPERLLAVHILYWLQYCLNVVVYVLLNRQYRDAYVDFLAKILPSWKRLKGYNFPWENPSTTVVPRAASSFKGYKDSSIVGKEAVHPSQATDNITSRHGRLSAIPEVNSSSVNNDSVFVDEKKNSNDVNDNSQLPISLNEPHLKLHYEEGTDDEKQLWISQDGHHRVAEETSDTEVKV